MKGIRGLMYNGNLSVYLIGEAASYVDLGFIPSGSVFYSAYDMGGSTHMGRSVMVVDSNSERTISKLEKLLEEGANCVQVVWNAARWKDYSHSMLAFARKSDSYDLALRGTPAKLTVWQAGLGPGSSSPSIEAMRDALIEQLRSPSPLSKEETECLVKAYAKLLRELEQQVQRNFYLLSKLSEVEQKVRDVPLLIEQVRELNSENEMLSQKNLELSEGTVCWAEDNGESAEESKESLQGSGSSTELDALKKEYAELQSEHDRLRSRYDALANSKLGAFTLRRWERKAKPVDK